MKNSQEYQKKPMALFKEDELIFCPSDIMPKTHANDPDQAPMIWKVTHADEETGDITAVPAGGQNYPSEHYPKGPMTIILQAQNSWEKVDSIKPK